MFGFVCGYLNVKKSRVNLGSKCLLMHCGDEQLQIRPQLDLCVCVL